MHSKTILLLCGLGLFVTSCVVTSLHPYYTSKDLLFQPDLLGQWTNTQQADERWTFERDGQNAYRLTYATGDGTNLTQAHFFKLGGQNFIDIGGLDQNWNTLPPPIPSHLLLRVLQLSPTLRMAPIANDWLKTLLEKQPGAIRHQLISDKNEVRVVLIDETKDLQTFITRHLKTEEAWKDSFELRKEPDQPGK